MCGPERKTWGPRQQFKKNVLTINFQFKFIRQWLKANQLRVRKRKGKRECKENDLEKLELSGGQRSVTIAFHLKGNKKNAYYGECGGDDKRDEIKRPKCHHCRVNP